MFFILSKVLVFAIRPLNWLVVLLLVSLFSKNEKRKRRCLRLALGGFLFFTNPFIINELYLLYEVPPVPPAALAEPFDVGIVLGGYSNFDTQTPDDLHPFSPSCNRLSQALELYQMDKIRKIMLVGGSGSLVSEEPSEADELQKWLLRLGVPEADILVENASRNTRENAVFAKNLLEKQPPGTTCLLLTSAWHLPRAMACFEKAGLKCTPFPVDFWGKPVQFKASHLLEPDERAFEKWELLLKEWLGRAVYRLKGYG